MRAFSRVDGAQLPYAVYEVKNGVPFCTTCQQALRTFFKHKFCSWCGVGVHAISPCSWNGVCENCVAEQMED